MVFDVKTQAMVNLTIQVLLIIMVSGAVFLAKKRNLGKHCIVMRVAVLLQIIAIASVMLPSMLGYIENEHKGIFFNIEMLVHHTLGLTVIVIWIYINLVFAGVMRTRGKLAAAMKLALASWILSLIIGLHMYVLIWK
jgi:putative membrane protein